MNTPDKTDDGEIKKLADAALEPTGGAPTEGDGDEKPGSEDGDVKVFLQGVDGSLPPKHNSRGFQDRINGLNAKINIAEGGAAQHKLDLENARNENQVLRLALDQQKETALPPGPPDPLTFDDGASDSKYLAAFDSYISDLVEKKTPPPPAQTSVNSGLHARQIKHYEAAEKLGVKDFPETEDKAISILGKNTVNFIIENAVNSSRVLYYLGKNPDDAEELAHLVKTQKPGQAVMMLGVLDNGVKLSSDAKPSTVPNPDEDLEGTVLKSASDYDRKLDKLRDAGNIEAIMTFKRKHQATQRA